MHRFVMTIWRAIPLLFPLLFALAAAPYGLAATPEPRRSMPLDGGWEFARADRLPAGIRPELEPAAGNWEQVSLPHSFNAEDGTRPGYYRGAAWYRRDLTVDRPDAGRTYIEFDGAALSTDVWLNGAHLGRHEGGFARFRFDLSGLLKPGANRLVVRVDNALDPNVAPLGGDYTLFGGLYRSVRLVRTGDVHVDMLDHGASGAYFRASGVSAAGARLHWVARLANDSSRALTVRVRARLRDAAGRQVALAQRTVRLPARGVLPVALDAPLRAPHLWQGVEDPYLYASEVEIVGAGAGSELLDRVADRVGIREVAIDPTRGVLLNGRPVAVHGVNVHHTYVPGKGWAASDADVDADYTILDELGVTGLRFAHYQHGQHSYALADRKGYLVWTELPLTSEVNASPAFQANLARQTRELVRQNINHPSVFVWGLGNEIYKVDAASSQTLDAMQRLVHEEDPSRPTAYANCCAPLDGPQASHTDVVASNVYFGWYDKEFADLGPWMAANRALRPSTPQALSEYGAGASVLHQEDPPARPKPAGKWHPEQYQALYHEAAWPQIAGAPWLWASFVWVGFDFPSAGRDEGDSAGINDKGLVTLDRKARKDAYYWYQANWSSRPMLHIASRRHLRRTAADAEVKVYTNQDTVGLRVNGVDQGTRSVVGRIARWQVKLAPGPNRIEALSAAGADSVEWEVQPAAH